MINAMHFAKLNTDTLTNYNFPVCNKNLIERLWYISEPNSEACYTDYESAATVFGMLMYATIN